MEELTGTGCFIGGTTDGKTVKDSYRRVYIIVWNQSATSALRSISILGMPTRTLSARLAFRRLKQLARFRQLIPHYDPDGITACNERRPHLFPLPPLLLQTSYLHEVLMPLVDITTSSFLILATPLWTGPSWPHHDERSLGCPV